MLKPGQEAPDFEGRDQHGDPVRLRDLRGQWVVLYFYPKDETTGCTAEACAFRDALSDFEDLDAAVVGVSTQGVDSHRAFAEHHGLPFPLVADADKAISKRYDALGLLGVNRRVTYVVDPEGRIRDAYRSELRPRSHVDHAREVLEGLRSSPVEA